MSDPVVVVGASASGLFAATRLAQAGRPVTVYERAEHLPPSSRSLIVTSRFKDFLGGDGQGTVVNEVRHFELFADGKVAGFDLKSPDLIVDRARVIHRLARHARDAGAEIKLGHRFQQLQSSSRGVEVKISGAPGKQDVRREVTNLVGADGARSRVAAAAGWPMQPTIPLLQAIVRLPTGFPDYTSRVWFRPEDTPYFYWLIPDAEGRGALGIIGDQPQTIRRRLDAFLESQRLEPLEYQAAQIPRYSRWIPLHKHVGGGHIHLVGDAAGHVKVSTVGGLVTGFRGAAAVVDSIVSGRPSLQLLGLRWELDLHLQIRKALHRFDQNAYVRLLELLGGAAAQKIGVETRDDAAKLLWKTLLAEPRYALLGMRAVMSGGLRPRW